MIVIVAEKPSVGRDIARVLGCTERGEGCLKGPQYTVTWAVGHLVTLCEPDEIDPKYKKWRADMLPILPEKIPTKVIQATKKQFSVVKKWMNAPETTSLICATDAGREGELIFHYIYDQAQCHKPVDRLWISSMTDEAIREGFENLQPDTQYAGLHRSAVCRSEADWMVGMNASRAFTLRYGTLLSIGRVQTPTLALLVQRRKEIDSFVPQNYWQLNADFGDYHGLWFNPALPDPSLRSHIPTADQAESLAQRVRGKEAVVQSVQSESKRELPPQLYDLTSLQRDANRKLGFTASKTLKIAQSLYEKYKLLTYPRTDSRYLPPDMIPRLYQTLKVLPSPYREMEQGMERKEDGKLRLSKRIFDASKVTDHHALLPTPKAPNLDKLPSDERKLYDLVAKRMIAAFYPAYEYDAITVITVCEGELFRSSGRTVRQPGWRALESTEKKQSTKSRGEEDEVQSLPALAEGDRRIVKKAAVKQQTTKPPAEHTDASLLSSMEHAGRQLESEELRESMKDSGLGTPATRAAIIDRLIQVGYVRRAGKTLQATPKGVLLIDAAPTDLVSAEMTGKWEAALNRIARNEGDADRFMEGIRRMSAFLVTYCAEKAPDVPFPPEESRYQKKARSTGAKVLEQLHCPLCGKALQETEKAFGCSAWREGCHFTLWKDCLKRGGGPGLNQRIVQKLLETHRVQGSTGVLTLQNQAICFTPAGKTEPACSVPIVYQKNANKH